jgi:hypothetical protein
MSKNNNNKLCVFKAQWEGDKLIDVGNDPCFDHLPTWGICRPNIRKSLIIGSRVFFIGYVKDENKYFVKGWMEVGEKISYIEALNRFPNKENVIISKENNHRELKWRYKELKQFYTQLETKNTDFLAQINSKEGVFYQNPIDDHEIDNWKCRRIFHCDKRKFTGCASIGNCALDDISIELDKYKNYIVANPNKWGEYGKFRIEYEEIRDIAGINKNIKTPKGQHNALNLSDEGMDKIIKYLSNRIKQDN